MLSVSSDADEPVFDVERLAHATKSSLRKNLNSHTIGKFNYARQFEYDQSTVRSLAPRFKSSQNCALPRITLHYCSYCKGRRAFQTRAPKIGQFKIYSELVDKESGSSNGRHTQ
jgi:hypothetical protein